VQVWLQLFFVVGVVGVGPGGFLVGVGVASFGVEQVLPVCKSPQTGYLPDPCAVPPPVPVSVPLLLQQETQSELWPILE
jgi:hypothetical protein